MSEVKVDTISERTTDAGVTIEGVKVEDGVATFQTAAGSPLVFEGATADAFETTFAITDPTADRTITFPDSSFTVPTSGGLTAASQWRLTADFSSSADPVTANLDEVDAPVGFGVLGSSMVLGVGTGEFTFPVTGYWEITSHVSNENLTTGNNWVQSYIYTTINDSTWLHAASAYGGSYYVRSTGVCSYIMDVTDVTLCKVRFRINVLASAVVKGDTAFNETYFNFNRLADT